MNIRFEDGLLFVSAIISYRGRSITLNRVVLDTGSVGTIFATHQLERVDLRLEMNDIVDKVQGIGGFEFVVLRQIDGLTIGDLHVNNFEIEVGAMKYHQDLDGLVGADFLTRTRAIVDLDQFALRKAQT
jgi:hypothetical protein